MTIIYFGSLVPGLLGEPTAEGAPADIAPESSCLTEERENQTSASSVEEDAVTPVQARVFGLWSAAEGEYLSSRTTPTPQVYYLAAGPTPDTPPPPHPTAVTVPARSTSPPPSPSSLRPRNLDHQLLAAASTATFDHDDVCRGCSCPISPTALEEAFSGFHSSSDPDFGTISAVTQLNPGFGEPRRLQAAPVPRLPVSPCTGNHATDTAPPQDYAPDPAQLPDQGTTHIEARRPCAEEADCGDVHISPEQADGRAVKEAEREQPSPTGAGAAAAAADVFGQETSPALWSAAGDVAAELGLESRGAEAGLLQQQQSAGAGLVPHGESAPQSASCAEPVGAVVPAPGPTPAKAGGVLQTPARKATGSHKAVGATPASALTPVTERRPAPWGGSNTARGSAAAGSHGAAGAPRTRRNVCPAIMAAATGAAPRSPGPSPAPCGAGAGIRASRGSASALGRRGSASSPGGPEGDTAGIPADALFSTPSAAGKLAGDAQGSPGASAGTTPRYAAPTAASLARLSRKEAQARNGGATQLPRQQLSLRLPISSPGARAGAHGSLASQRHSTVLPNVSEVR